MGSPPETRPGWHRSKIRIKLQGDVASRIEPSQAIARRSRARHSQADETAKIQPGDKIQKFYKFSELQISGHSMTGKKMTTVAVVIPYFQRKAGILKKTLETVAEQRLDDDTKLDVIIVDDESPSPVEPEIDGIKMAERHAIRVVRQPNGGPAKARNAGLEAVSKETDYVAFLDSDDLWKPEHIATAIASLRAGTQFFFCDHEPLSEDDGSWFNNLTFWNPQYLKDKADAIIGAPGAFSMSSGIAFDLFIQEYAAHTSTVVYDYRQIPSLRFNTSLLFACEDYLFFLELVHASKKVSFSTHVNASRGRGINMYASQYDWSSPGCTRRYLDLLAFRVFVRDDLLTGRQTEKEKNDAFIGLYRNAIIYLALRYVFKNLRPNLSIFRKIGSIDRGFWPSFPRNLAKVVMNKLTGTLEMPVG